MQYGPPFFLKVGVHFAPPESKVKDDKIPLSPLFSLAIYLLFQLTLNTTLVLFPAITEYEKRNSVY
jgi:hypothetical protein